MNSTNTENEATRKIGLVDTNEKGHVTLKAFFKRSFACAPKSLPGNELLRKRANERSFAHDYPFSLP